MTPTEQDKELREAILLEFKNVHRLAPAGSKLSREDATEIRNGLVRLAKEIC